jgi:thiol:disulfide interchange protein
VAFRWFNIIGFLMLLFALFLNEVVYLNVWYDSNFTVIVPAILYLVVGLWLSLWEGPRRQDA